MYKHALYITVYSSIERTKTKLVVLIVNIKLELKLKNNRVKANAKKINISLLFDVERW